MSLCNTLVSFPVFFSFVSASKWYALLGEIPQYHSYMPNLEVLIFRHPNDVNGLLWYHINLVIYVSVFCINSESECHENIPESSAYIVIKPRLLSELSLSHAH